MMEAMMPVESLRTLAAVRLPSKAKMAAASEGTAENMGYVSAAERYAAGSGLFCVEYNRATASTIPMARMPRTEMESIIPCLFMFLWRNPFSVANSAYIAQI
jgi:hypothetical protein